MRGTRWTVTFEEDGGYDCMSAAYVIRADGRILMRVDVADFKREWLKTNLAEDARYKVLHAEDEGAANLAHFIVNALNLHGL